jgi:flagellar assembly protein FliH
MLERERDGAAFVPLDAFFRALHAPPAQASLPSDEESAVAPDGQAEVAPQSAPSDLEEACAAVRRFRAALADALDATLEALLRDIACDVLARELALAPADLASIVGSALERFAADAPVAVRAHPEEAGTLAGLDLKIVPDVNLRRGDVVIDVAFGSIDATLGARLDSVLAR